MCYSVEHNSSPEVLWHKFEGELHSSASSSSSSSLYTPPFIAVLPCVLLVTTEAWSYISCTLCFCFFLCFHHSAASLLSPHCPAPADSLRHLWPSLPVVYCQRKFSQDTLRPNDLNSQNIFSSRGHKKHKVKVMQFKVEHQVHFFVLFIEDHWEPDLSVRKPTNVMAVFWVEIRSPHVTTSLSTTHHRRKVEHYWCGDFFRRCRDRRHQNKGVSSQPLC